MSGECPSRRGLKQEAIKVGVVAYFDENMMKSQGYCPALELRPWHIRGGTARPYMCVCAGSESTLWAPLTTDPTGNLKVPSNLKHNFNSPDDTYVGAAVFVFCRELVTKLTWDDHRGPAHRPWVERPWVMREVRRFGLLP